MVLTRGQKDRRIQLDGLVCRVAPEAVCTARELEKQEPAAETEEESVEKAVESLEPAPKRSRVWGSGVLRKGGESASSSSAGVAAPVAEEDWPLGQYILLFLSHHLG